MSYANSQFVSGRGRTQLLVIFLFAGIVVALVHLVFNFFLLVILPQTTLGDLTVLGEESWVDLLQVLLSLLQFLIFIMTAVLFLMWIHRAYKNLSALGVSRLEYSPGWAVGGFFIPLASLYIPYRVMKEIWVKSGSQVNAPLGTYAPQGGSLALLGWWWGFWVVSNVLDQAVFRMYRLPETPDLLFTIAKVEIVADAVSIIAAFLAIQVVKGISDRQEESSRLLQTFMPPPPPSEFMP
ncbi:MAG TPA: DUF4328 domain-containing protein [Pyrinomonadaceae bacterium]|jgi:hypothetical protein|nr:DUF4328 domain-containing protein [Pyrinomonadaceae bacterium]